MENMRTDAILMEILVERVTITGFLDSVFGFLRRNTDFYHIKKNNENIGFPKGMKEQILFGAMQRYDPDFIANQLITEDDDVCVPPAVEEIEIEIDKNVNNTEHTIETQKETSIQNSNEQDKISPTKENFSINDYKNGSHFEQYCWSQSLKDVEMHVLLPQDLRSSRALSITIKADKIRVCSKANPALVVLEGILSNKCRHNDFVWTISEGKLLISLDKIKEQWWEKLFENESAIDVRQINCERFIDELPEESQAAIEKLRIDQMRKDKKNAAQTSAQTDNKTLERLRKAWDVEGSPFRGQPFDPSMVQFN